MVYASKLRVIIHNDDFGLSYGFTEAIKDSFLKGITTSTSIRTNGTAYDYAVRLLKTRMKRIGLGLHLNLIDGKAHVTALANPRGKYRLNYGGYYLSLLKPNPKLLAYIEEELDYQFRKVLSDGLGIDHVNSHDHVHMIPPIFQIICKLCKKYGVKYIRLAREPYYLTGSFKKDCLPYVNLNVFKFLLLNYFSRQDQRILRQYQLNTVDAFYGVLHTNNMNIQIIEAVIKNALNQGFRTIEILGHPAYPDDPRDTIFSSQLIKNYIQSNNRRAETTTFQSEKLKEIIKKPNIRTISYHDLT